MIKIKGINNNLVVVFGEGSFDDYYAFLQERFNSNKQLFGGSRVVFKGEGLQLLNQQELSQLQRLCLDNGMILNNSEILLNKKAPEKNQERDTVIYRNVRSGQKIISEGSVLVWGDVHESAEIIAAQDIIVLGKLQGIAHAGYRGNLDSVVFALELSPSQIRIANKISRSADEPVQATGPEIAFWEDDNICIKEYRSRNNTGR
jgi:septum site-determining protein MinC